MKKSEEKKEDGHLRNLMMGGACLFSLFLMAAPVWAQGSEERDPFFPSGRRPSGPAQPRGDADWGRDPFNRPFSGPPSGQSRSSAPAAGGLTGIIYGKNVRLAIMGGEVLREGSMVGGRRLVDIRKKSVVLMSDAGRYEEIFLEDFSLGR